MTRCRFYKRNKQGPLPTQINRNFMTDESKIRNGQHNQIRRIINGYYQLIMAHRVGSNSFGQILYQYVHIRCVHSIASFS